MQSSGMLCNVIEKINKLILFRSVDNFIFFSNTLSPTNNKSVPPNIPTNKTYIGVKFNFVDIFIAGLIREKNVAAIITPALKLKNESSKVLFTFLNRNTLAEPNVVIRNVKIHANKDCNTGFNS